MTTIEAGACLLPRRSARGFSLLELLIAMFVFLLVILAAYQVFDRSNEGYRRGQNQAEMVQSARVAFDDAVNSIRMAGFEFDIDGTSLTYPNQPDEAIEYMADHAVTVRANFDFEQGNLRGREAALERSAPEGASVSIDQCCPIVTTANDEVVTYALGKNFGDPNPPAQSIVVTFDSTGTDPTIELPDDDGDYADGAIRDAYVDGAGVIHDEETLTIPNVALTLFDNPPYVLYKFTFNPDGSVNRQPLVDNVKALNFVYYAEDGTVIAGNAGTDAGRTARWNVRRVGITLIAMEPEFDKRYTDATDAEPKSRKHRKYTLTEDVFPPNMGRRGQLDKSVNAPAPITNVSVCTRSAGSCASRGIRPRRRIASRIT